MENSCHEDLQEVVDEGADESKAKRDKTDCSHRVIEKRRRDRINNSLMQLSKLVPVDKFNKKNSGKLEKAEILEVTVQYLTEQQQQQQKKQEQQLEQNGNPGQTSHEGSEDAAAAENTLQLFLRGFKTCIVDATKFFQEVEELDVSEGRCHRLIQHLKQREHRYESKGEIPVKDSGDDRVWEGGDSSKDYTLRRSSELPVAGQPSAIVKCENLKRKKEDKEITTPKKPRMNPPAANGSESHPPGEQDLSSPANFSNDVSQSNTDSSNAMRNFMPFLLPNVPFFPTFPFTGTNGVPRYQAPQAQFPGYSFPQSATSYIPVALPQFPYMGMNFMSGFGMVNNDQQQNNGMASTMSSMTSGLPNAMVNGMPNAVPNAMPNGVNGGFFPSMYSNGIHANIMAMRPRDSGYESSDRSSSKESRSETSPPSFSDDSCQSFIT